jgi:hypothetical protein
LGIPVIVTPLSRRNYEGNTLIQDPLDECAAATRKQAAQDHVPVIDLYQMSVAMLSAMSQKQADGYDANVHEDAKAEGATAAKPDRTRLNDLGKLTFGDMVARAVYRQLPDLKKYMIIRLCCINSGFRSSVIGGFAQAAIVKISNSLLTKCTSFFTCGSLVRQWPRRIILITSKALDRSCSRLHRLRAPSGSNNSLERSVICFDDVVQYLRVLRFVESESFPSRYNRLIALG